MSITIKRSLPHRGTDTILCGDGSPELDLLPTLSTSDKSDQLEKNSEYLLRDYIRKAKTKNLPVLIDPLPLLNKGLKPEKLGELISRAILYEDIYGDVDIRIYIPDHTDKSSNDTVKRFETVFQQEIGLLKDKRRTKYENEIVSSAVKPAFYIGFTLMVITAVVLVVLAIVLTGPFLGPIAIAGLLLAALVAGVALSMGTAAVGGAIGARMTFPDKDFTVEHLYEEARPSPAESNTITDTVPGKSEVLEKGSRATFASEKTNDPAVLSSNSSMAMLGKLGGPNKENRVEPGLEQTQSDDASLISAAAEIAEKKADSDQTHKLPESDHPLKKFGV